MKKIYIFFIVVSILFTGCALNDKQEKYPFYETNMDVYEIKTDYCNLYYPNVWKDKTLVNVTNDNGCSVEFTAIMDEKNVSVFSFIFDGKEGEKIGVLNIENQEVDVLIETNIINEEEFSKEEIKVLRGMSEDINVIISKLIEMYEFELV